MTICCAAAGNEIAPSAIDAQNTAFRMNMMHLLFGFPSLRNDLTGTLEFAVR
jgi:hypothetical protein